MTAVRVFFSISSVHDKIKHGTQDQLLRITKVLQNDYIGFFFFHFSFASYLYLNEMVNRVKILRVRR